MENKTFIRTKDKELTIEYINRITDYQHDENVLESAYYWIEDVYSAICDGDCYAVAQGLWNGYYNCETSPPNEVASFLNKWM